MKRGRHLRIFKDEGGQAVVEGAIGIALMAFTWTCLVVLSVMSTNAPRTAMAARYAAWNIGNNTGLNVNVLEADIINRFFFHDAILIDLAVGNAEVPNYKPDEDDVEELVEDGEGPYRATVRFGAFSQLLQQTQMPWIMLRTDIPIMPSMDDVQSLYVVDTACQWDEVGETWQTGKAAFQGIYDAIKKQIENAVQEAFK